MHTAPVPIHQKVIQHLAREWRLLKLPAKIIVTLILVGALFVTLGPRDMIAIPGWTESEDVTASLAADGSVLLHTDDDFGFRLHCPRFIQKPGKAGQEQQRNPTDIVSDTLAHNSQCRRVQDPKRWHNIATPLVVKWTAHLAQWMREHENSVDNDHNNGDNHHADNNKHDGGKKEKGAEAVTSLFIDVGAHIGEASFRVANSFSHVVAIDAVHSNIAAMEKTKKLEQRKSHRFENVDLLEAAVDAKSGMACVAVSLRPLVDASDYEIVCEQNSPVYMAHQNEENAIVHTTTLDEIFRGRLLSRTLGRQHFDIKVIKLDLLPSVASAVLAGGRSLFANCTGQKSRGCAQNPHIIYTHIEGRRSAAGNKAKREYNEIVPLLKLLRKAGYAVVLMSAAAGNPLSVLATDEQFEHRFESSARSKEGATVFFLRGDVAPELVSFAANSGLSAGSSYYHSSASGWSTSFIVISVGGIVGMAMWCSYVMSTGIGVAPFSPSEAMVHGMPRSMAQINVPASAAAMNAHEE